MIFEVGTDQIKALERVSFGQAGLKERSDLQRLLRDQIEIVAPDVLVISEEFGEWTDSRRRIDLLAVDTDANLVVIELKRTEDGGHMELQALRYAAMVSTLTAERAIEIFGAYLESRGRDEDPQATLLEFLSWDELDEDQFAQDVRIVLVSADFSRELSTAVIWLNEKDLDVRCVRIRPYGHDGRTLIDVQQVIPLPEAADYQVKVREKKRKERGSRKGGPDFTRFDVVVGGKTYLNQWKRNAILLAVKPLCERGVAPEEIARGMGRSMTRLWRSVDGEVTNPDEFHVLAAADAPNVGSKYNPRRYHTHEGDLVTHDGRTYALTNQWGSRWAEAMGELKKNFPELGLDWSPSSEEAAD